MAQIGFYETGSRLQPESRRIFSNGNTSSPICETTTGRLVDGECYHRQGQRLLFFRHLPRHRRHLLLVVPNSADVAAGVGGRRSMDSGRRMRTIGSVARQPAADHCMMPLQPPGRGGWSDLRKLPPRDHFPFLQRRLTGHPRSASDSGSSMKHPDLFGLTMLSPDRVPCGLSM